MYIKTRVVTVVFRLSISALSAFASWLFFHIFGNEAWRLFSTWIMLIAAIYYFCLAFLPVFSKRRDSGRVICPTLQGTIIISGMVLAVFRLIFNTAGVQITGLEGVGMVLANFILPTMYLLDWFLFTKKGRWRAVDPFYWLALLICYGAWILLSAEFMNSGAALRYPYGFLDFNTIGIDFMLVWFAVIAVVVLALGYICVALDFAMSGNLAKYVVLPHIKTIIIEEEVETPPKTVVKAQTEEFNSNPSKKPAKTATNVKPTVKSGAASKKAQAAKANSKSQSKSNTPSTKPKTKSKKQPVALLEAETKTTRSAKAKKKAEKLENPEKMPKESSNKSTQKTSQK